MERDTNVVRAWLNSWSRSMLKCTEESGQPIADLVRQCYHYVGRADKDADCHELFNFWWMCINNTMVRIVAECHKAGVDCNLYEALEIIEDVKVKHENQPQ
jgi:hypothetical protein